MTGRLPWYRGLLRQWFGGALPRCPAVLRAGNDREYHGRCELVYGHVNDALPDVRDHALERGMDICRWTGDGRLGARTYLENP